MFPLESNEYIKYIIFNIKKKNHPKLSHICSYGIFFKELKNEFETAVVNEPSSFEPLKFYCIVFSDITSCWYFAERNSHFRYFAFTKISDIILEVPVLIFY